MINDDTITKHASKDAYNRDVYLFIIKKKKIIVIKEAQQVRDNL